MPATSTTSSRDARGLRAFCQRVRGQVERATFGGATDTGVQPFFERQGAAAEEPESRVMETPSSVESLAPPLPPPIPQPGPEFAERLARAVAELRHTGERLAEQMTADALEMAVPDRAPDHRGRAREQPGGADRAGSLGGGAAR